MDILRRKRSLLPDRAASAAAFAASSSGTPPVPSPTTASSAASSAPAGNGSISASSSSTKLYSKIQTDMSNTSLTSANSPSSSVDSKSGFFQTYMPKAMRSLSRGSNTSVRTNSTAPESPSTSTSPQQTQAGQFPRKVLQKSHHKRVSSHEFLSRRGSTSSEMFNRTSRASTIMSGSSSSTTVVDWRVQTAEKYVSLDYSDSQAARQNRNGYLVMTADYILIFKARNDAMAAFPALAESLTASGGPPVKSSLLPPNEPLHVVPLTSVLSIFRTDSVYSPFGIEIWWKLPYPVVGTSSANIYFNDHNEREFQLSSLITMVKSRTRDQLDSSRACYEVEECIRKVFRAEESNYMSSVPEIFPVVYRNAPGRLKTKGKSEDKKKGQLEGTSSYFLVVGINLCFFIEIGCTSVLQTTALEVRYQTCGLVTLESFRADWSPRDERFTMRFRDPFKNPMGLELSSRHYRHIILTLTKADKFLKPAWPTHWQTQEIFHVQNLPTPQHIVAGEDFGGFQRTHTAFCAAYRCDPVTWDANWRTEHAPEFRVLPPAKGAAYTDLQLLALLRALRYNDYFRAVSFANVDLSGLLNKYDSARKGNVAYLNRNGVSLTSHETSLVQKATIMHQEFHALAFASGKIRQIDFTNSLGTVYRGNRNQHSVQFLIPILNLLAAGLTRCSFIVMRGCHLGDVDVEGLVGYLAPTLTNENPDARIAPSEDAVGLEALDVANCGLTDSTMKALFQALSQSAGTLRTVDVSNNLGRVPAPMVQTFMESVGNLRHLNLSGSLTGTFDGELLPFEVLDRLELLEDLDISNFKLSNSSLQALERFIANLSAKQTQRNEQDAGYGCCLRRLVLNNCGISGSGAGRIFSSMSGLYDVHLYLNGNPLEDGIEDFVHALGQCWGGRFGLHMDMIEFLDEDNYILLINALAASWYVDYLSLVGTAPIPTGEDTCSDDICTSLERFFAENQSVRYLDISGFSGKLDDGQLGKGFGRAFRGLAHNKSLTHLRVRNQNLYDDAGTLGAAIQANSSLLYLDCGDNGFNLTGLRYLSKSLQNNITILVYPFTDEDVDQSLKDCLKDMPKPVAPAPHSKHHKKKATMDGAVEKQRALVREEIEGTVSEIASYMLRNKSIIEDETGCVVDMEEAFDTGGSAGWPSLQLRMPEGMAYTNVIQEEVEEEENPLEMQLQMRQYDRVSSSSSLLSGQGGPVAGQPFVSSDLAPPQEMEELQMPYRVSADDEALNSPIVGTNPAWRLPSNTPESLQRAAAEKQPESPVADTEFIEKAFFAGPDLALMLEKFSIEDSKYTIGSRSDLDGPIAT